MDKAQRKAERERRQERIKQSSSGRLAKITGAAGSKDFKTPVSECSLAEASQNAGCKEPEHNSDFQQFLKQNGETDPLFAMLAGQMKTQTDQKAEEHFANAQKRSIARADADLAWDVAHLLVSVLLGLYMALSNPWNITMAFLTAEGLLFASKVMLGHQNSGFPAVAMLAPVLGMLPRNRQRQLSVVGVLVNALRSAYKDIAIALLVYGCASSGGRNFARLAVL